MNTQHIGSPKVSYCHYQVTCFFFVFFFNSPDLVCRNEDSKINLCIESSHSDLLVLLGRQFTVSNYFIWDIKVSVTAGRDG